MGDLEGPERSAVQEMALHGDRSSRGLERHQLEATGFRHSGAHTTKEGGIASRAAESRPAFGLPARVLQSEELLPGGRIRAPIDERRVAPDIGGQASYPASQLLPVGSVEGRSRKMSDRGSAPTAPLEAGDADRPDRCASGRGVEGATDRTARLEDGD